MTTIYPGAKYLPVVNHGSGMSAHLGLCLHVQQGTGSLYEYFNNPAPGGDPSKAVSSSWWVSSSGLVEQYVDADLTAWAQKNGNGTYNSVETEGMPDTPLTTAQVNSLAGLYRWGHDTYGWPFAQSDTPGVPGFIYHGAGGDAWGGHPNCASAVRNNAREQILRIASGAVVPGGDRQPPLNPTTPQGADQVSYVVHTLDTAKQYQVFESGMVSALSSPGFGSQLTLPVAQGGAGKPFLACTQADVDLMVAAYKG